MGIAILSYPSAQLMQQVLETKSHGHGGGGGGAQAAKPSTGFNDMISAQLAGQPMAANAQASVQRARIAALKAKQPDPRQRGQQNREDEPEGDNEGHLEDQARARHFQRSTWA